MTCNLPRPARGERTSGPSATGATAGDRRPSWSLAREASARAEVARRFPYAHPRDNLRIECFADATRLRYEPTALALRNEKTVLKLQLDPRLATGWICELRVASPYRRQGVGRQLAALAEHLGREYRMVALHVFPLVTAGDFWQRVGYLPHPKMARVLRKALTVPAAFHG